MTRRRAHVPVHQEWGVRFAVVAAIAAFGFLVAVGSAFLSRITQ